MTDATETTREADAAGQEQIDTGSYELLRNRLIDQSKRLGQKADTLNDKRIEIFGGTEMTIAGTQRIRTENNCVPRDIIAVGNDLLFLGYNVQLGLRREVNTDDVFDVYKFEEIEGGFEFTEIPEEDERNFLDQPKFVEDFRNLYRYMKDSRLIQLRDFHTKMLAVFQVGTTVRDIKAFRWHIDTKVWPNTIHYVDDNGAKEHVFPPAHDFAWQPTGRDDFVFGTHPHVNVCDQVFVETVGGDLTVKVEDNTEDGTGIYSEPVDNADQTLDDGKIFYAELGTLILLKILPFGEATWRYLVFNTRTERVDRIDAIGKACVQLPEDHGIIFPGGYYLRSGETKSFEGDIEGMIFKGVTKSPNGEDVLYVFYEEYTGRSILLPYNLIRKAVQSPIHCHGYTLFDDGKMVIFRYDSEEPSRVHPVQIWQTPFATDEWAAQRSVDTEHAGSFLVKVGNKDLVRGISDCHSIRKMIQNQEPSTKVYEDLVAACTRLFDVHFWLGDEEIGDITATVKEIRATAELIIDEFEKVQLIQKAAREALTDAEKKQEDLLKNIRPDIWTTVDQFVDAMGLLNRQRGHLITLKDMRYINTVRIDEMEKVVGATFGMLTERAVEFLLGEDALKPYHDEYTELMVKIVEIQKSNEAVPLQAELNTTSENLDMLTEVISSLQIEDPAARTRILEEISEVFALFNRAKATLAGRRQDMLSEEGVAEFGAQFKLFAQAVQSAIAMADTPPKCDEQLTRLMVQIEELEARFSEFDQFLGDIAQKREEVYDALSAKKQQLLDERQRRAENVSGAADRILQGVGRRAASFKAIEDLNAYFASDAMILKVRDLAKQLVDLGDAMRSEQVIAKLRSARDNAARSLRDKTELYEEGENIIRLGKHRFAVNIQDLELTMIPRDGEMHLNLTGTSFFERLEDEALGEAKIYLDQTLVSETEEVYRGEYLAACMLFDAEAGKNGLTLDRLTKAQIDKDLLTPVREYAASRYDEGYERGVHDNDAVLILQKLLGLRKTSGLLRFGPTPRSFACLFWAALTGPEANDETKAMAQKWTRTGKNLGRLRDTFSATETMTEFAGELGEAIGEFLADNDIDHHFEEARIAGLYLAEELAEEPLAFALSGEAVRLKDKLFEHLDRIPMRKALEQDLNAMANDLSTRYALALAWCDGFIAASDREEIRALKPVVREAAVLLLTEGILAREQSGALTNVEVDGVLGQHPRISHQKLPLRLDEFLERLSTFIQVRAPGYRAYRELRSNILERERRNLRLDEFKPKVLTSFVRNKLINDVYLPLVGDNLAKQMGAAGDAKRTDLMGMLLLISPPGYGKTTLMEYIANRLGLIFMKINGPALGHSVESLDPAEAPNATARQELHKLNLALEMGNNVMLYIDDIQHTNPELLQKFISLCDAQRRIEGVWKGRARTYDLRGRRFCVCMAGNPYTESGEKFQIPDMLANRADVYNLGDVLSGREDAFALSYIENAITSNHVLAPLATREQADIYTLVRMAQGEQVPTSDLKHNLSKVEVEEIVTILKKLFVCRDVLLKVNAQYIYSAAQDDRFRTEPRFQLQGSYRNMNKLTEKVVAAMNDQELAALIDDHYLGEAQTLTTGAEANLLKLKEMLGTQTATQKARWDEIKRGFARHQLATGDEDDPVTRVTNQLSALNENIHGVRESIEAAATRPRAGEEKTAAPTAPAPVAIDMSPYLAELNQVLRTVAARPVEVKTTRDDAGTDFAPVLDRLNGVLEALAESRSEVATPPPASIPAPAPDVTPYLEQLNQVLRYLAKAQKTAAEPTPAALGLTEIQFKQLAVVRNSLRVILEDAQVRLKTEDTLSAAKVWKQVSEAMEILESIG